MLNVAAALIWKNGKFMICQRSEAKARGLKWEFVGGKLEKDETPRQALIRECHEELDITVEPTGIFCELDHVYPDITIHLVLMNAKIVSGTPKLLEHHDLKWITPSEISNYDFCPADEKILDLIKKRFASMRRKDRQTDDTFALSLLEKAQFATVSMVDEAGLPYAVPVSIACDGENIYFHSARSGKKCGALRKNPAVCVTVVGNIRPTTTEFSTEYESATVFGTATEVENDDEKVAILRLLCEKYCPTYMPSFKSETDKSLKVTAVWKISVDNVTGKRKVVK